MPRGCCCSPCSSRLQARRGQLDALLMFCTVLSLYCLLRQLLLGGGWWWAVGAGLAAGLGTLAKVVGFLSFLVLLPWLYAVWRGWPGVKWQRPLAMWLRQCRRPGARWWAPGCCRSGCGRGTIRPLRDYLHELVVTQTFDRYVAPWHHFKPAWYYLQVMATLWLPAVALLPWLVPRWRDALRAARCPGAAAAGIRGAVPGVLYAQPRQARSVHPVGAADARAGGGSSHCRRCCRRGRCSACWPGWWC